jgi:hypothetical protein
MISSPHAGARWRRLCDRVRVCAARWQLLNAAMDELSPGLV